MQAALADALRAQAGACTALGSPLTARVLSRLAADGVPSGPLADRLAGWPGDLSSSGASVPLRLAGALHALVRAGLAPTLARIYADPAPYDDAALTHCLRETIGTHQPFILRFIESAPQTNEVRRAAALIAGAHWLHRRTGLPLVLSELGASAGVNLLWDKYALQVAGRHLGPAAPALTLTPDWQGPPPAPAPHPPVVARAGVDLNPLDPVSDSERLMAYIWPDQPDRLARTAAALHCASLDRPAVARGDAIDWLADRLAHSRSGALHLVYHTIAWQYFPPDRQQRGTHLLAMAGARATPEAPLARLAMEADTEGPGAALTVTLWPGGEQTVLGRVDFHGRSILWQAGWAGGATAGRTN